MRQLWDAWSSFFLRSAGALQRNERVNTSSQKSFKKAQDKVRTSLGPLLTTTELQVAFGTRQVWLAFALFPHFGNEPVEDALGGIVIGLARPGGRCSRNLDLEVWGHAVDRVIQRSGVVATPLKKPDIHAINAEFADLLHFADAAMAALSEMGDAEAARANVLLPSQHGFFLGDFDKTRSTLRIKTFVDEAKLVDAERQALEDLGGANQAELALLAAKRTAPLCITEVQSSIPRRLREIWRTFGQRLAQTPLPPGLSTRAWSSRPSP